VAGAAGDVSRHVSLWAVDRLIDEPL
jgi:hypothetical protein